MILAAQIVVQVVLIPFSAIISIYHRSSDYGRNDTRSQGLRRYISSKRYAEDDVTSVRRALRVAALPESWKEYFRDRLQKMRTAVA